MYQTRTRALIAPGKMAEAKSVLTEWVKSRQAAGIRMALAQRIFSTEGPMLVVVRFAQSIDEIEATRKASMNDPEFRALNEKMSGLVADPARQILLESIVDLPAGSAAGTTISVLTSISPTPGKERQVLEIVEEFVKARQKGGVRQSLWRRIYSSDGPQLTMSSRHVDLAEADRTRKEWADRAVKAAAAVAELSRTPIQQRLLETIVPLQPA